MNGHFTAAFLLILLLASITAATQTDSANHLPEVKVQAFEQNRRLKDLPAAVHVVSSGTLQRFSPASVVHAVNTTPGVRMEERSPGSYRFNIRGSSLRSPFGVRNVKTYFNDLPITDPGGLTYINQLGFYNFRSIEIIRGPGNSLYGAGTGGVLLIDAMGGAQQPGVMAEYTAGSFGLHQAFAGVTTTSNNFISQLSYQHQQSSGYRSHSRLRRDVFTWTGEAKLSPNSKLKTTFLYGDLFYQTPGALTRTEYERNASASRPGNAVFPGAEAAGASIAQKQVIAGASLTQRFSDRFHNKSVLYGMFTELRNPNIQNYSRNLEPHGGLRSVFTYAWPLHTGEVQLTWGGEAQMGFANVSIHKNAGGIPDTLRSEDAIRNMQSMGFVQTSITTGAWTATLGASVNYLNVRVQRFTPATTGLQRRNFSNGLTPRLALMRRIGAVNVYATAAKGFSPPTTSELLPTGGAINLDLQAENGWNYELGAKASLFKRLFVDVNAFRFALRNTIVQRRTAGGSDFYINAGGTRQYGVETYISYPLLHRSRTNDNGLLWLSHTYHRFNYAEFVQGNNNFSGKQMPATPLHTLSAGADLTVFKNWRATTTYYYSGRLPVNDANTEFANAYHLMGARLAYTQNWGAALLRCAVGVENLLNQQYSLGNDVNGFGGRFFNAAPGRNVFVTITAEWRKRKEREE